MRSVEDPLLVAELAERGVTLNVCPYGNVLIGLYPNRESHPIRELLESGVRVTLSTDAPGFYGLTLEGEYLACAETYGWDSEVLRRLARTSVEASFCREPLKSELLKEIDAAELVT